MWHLPAVVAGFLLWLSAPPTSLADAARHELLRRQMAGRAVARLSNDSLPPAPPSSAPPAAGAEPVRTEGPPTAEAPAHDERWWHDRITTARETLSRDQLLAEALQSRIDQLLSDWSARDDPAQKARLSGQRQQALKELAATRARIAEDQQAIDAIAEEARRQGVPPGWIR